MEQTDILKRPRLTEKLEDLSKNKKVNGGKERYAFVVDSRANKIQIGEAVEKMYNVQVDAVNTMNHKGKAKNRNTRTHFIQGRTPSYKKAIVTLKVGEIIDFFENV
jgi:large subunit ribosomal protein L23